MIKSVKAKRDIYYDSTTDGHKMRVHELSIEEGIPCCVRKMEPCPLCYKDSRRYPMKLRHNNHNNLSMGLRIAIIKLDDRIREEQYAVREEEEERDAELQDGYFTQPRVTEEDMLRLEQKQINTQVAVRNIRASNVTMRKETQQLNKDNFSLNERFDSIKNDVDYVLKENIKLKHQVANLASMRENILQEFCALKNGSTT
ncbi:hypothetical protein PHYBOEH_000963 [Phytophthora boehmeriae]|uniref:Uncharacterized protein n=1 Tax=Phytophthora boehmeriae TaxID=109152 RepID=A0A8T1V8H8_9STRA|nr:hypothetical protein PHYBOEH_000963 [Phytophthora boehmeriae]